MVLYSRAMDDFEFEFRLFQTPSCQFADSFSRGQYPSACFMVLPDREAGSFQVRVQEHDNPSNSQEPSVCCEQRLFLVV